MNRGEIVFELNRLYNVDCMEGMKEIPDGYFQLAIIDPPYGIGESGKKNKSRGRLAVSQDYAPISVGIGTRRRLNTSQNCGGFPAIKLYSAQTTLSAGYRLTVRAGLYGTRKTGKRTLPIVN